MTSDQTPFSIAVTGHRDIRPQDVPALRREVANIFEILRRRMPGRPLKLLSGIAEGADQLVAEVAHENRLLLAAVIPMPLDTYREQMSPAAQQKLDQLDALADSRILLPLDGRTADELRASEQARAQCYEALALYLVRNSHALIALWDGHRSDKAGGTCRVVNYARFGSDPAGAHNVETHCEAVYHVMTPRLSNPAPAPEIRTSVLEPLPPPAGTNVI
jgi:hypothetical protein